MELSGRPNTHLLVEFMEDRTLFVCEIEKSRKTARGTKVRWLDGRLYLARILLIGSLSDLNQILEDVCGTPYVYVERLSEASPTRPTSNTFALAISKFPKEESALPHLSEEILVLPDVSEENLVHLPTSKKHFVSGENDLPNDDHDNDVQIRHTSNTFAMPVPQFSEEEFNEKMPGLHVSEEEPIYLNEECIVLEKAASPRNDGTWSSMEQDLDILEDAIRQEIMILDSEESVSRVPGSEIPKKSSKKHCCFFCKKLVFKISRHYIDVHKKNKEVIEISALPPNSQRRKMLLDKLRKQGDHDFNSTVGKESNKKIVVRETLKAHKTVREKDVPCPQCKGYYSKYSIRHHISRCITSQHGKQRKNIQAECRRLQNDIHHIASDVLRTKIFPVLNDDEITNAIRYDEAIINYSNYLCRKYTSPHHAQQIRSNMRALGRLIVSVREMNPQIHNLTEALETHYVDLIVTGIDKVAGLDENTHLYKSPATAMLIATELKKLCKMIEIEFIKKGDMQGQKKMENLSTLFSLEFNVTVNKKGLETQKIRARRKKTDLPKTEHIAQFRSYLENRVSHFTKRLSSGYSKDDWIQLAEYTLVHLAVFNRKRPGETQRILIEDFTHYEIINDDEITDEYDSISKEQIRKWARIRFTGKLGKNTALLVHRDLGFGAINLILKYRENAGVPKENPYVFGEPSSFHNSRTFQACQLIRKFAAESGIEHSELLRTRLLRQHLATETATSSVDDRVEGRVSDFMSHKRQIHEDYYVRTQKKDDITKVSVLLEDFSSSNKKKSLTSKPAAPHSTLISKPATPLNTPIVTATTSRCDSPSSGEEYTPDIRDLTLSEAEIDYVMGKQRSRRLWTTEEKNTARSYFYNEIQLGHKISRQKAKRFFEKNIDIFKHRSPHLIMQWVNCERKKVLAQESGKKAERTRWATPEKEVLRTSTERHSNDGTLPSIPECELLLQENIDILRKRNPQSLKTYMYNAIKKQRESI